ncbi:MAG: FHA domain-containing protein, partial [Candidatus Eremiobacterota bacterium]
MSWSSGLQLRVVGGSDRDRVIPLLTKEVIMGRATGAKGKPKEGHIYFTDPTVSRAHASLMWDHRRKVYVLTHLSRTNATKVDGERVTQAPVKVGSSIQMGHVLLVMEPLSKRAPL